MISMQKETDSAELVRKLIVRNIRIAVRDLTKAANTADAAFSMHDEEFSRESRDELDMLIEQCREAEGHLMALRELFKMGDIGIPASSEPLGVGDLVRAPDDKRVTVHVEEPGSEVFVRALDELQADTCKDEIERATSLNPAFAAPYGVTGPLEPEKSKNRPQGSTMCSLQKREGALHLKAADGAVVVIPAKCIPLLSMALAENSKPRSPTLTDHATNP